MRKTYLETQRLRLRELTPDETDIFFDIDSDPEVMKYLSGGKPSSRELCEKAVQRTYAYYEKYQHKFGLWIAEEKETSDYIGWFLLRPDKKKPEDTNNPELGYRLKKKFWGQGYATEGALALVEKAFTQLHCKSVFAITMVGNLGSQNVMKKVGMQFIGNYEQEECFAPGNDPSAVHYAITMDEWQNRS